MGATGPVADAAAMRMTRRNGTDYGAIRAWATVGYMVLNVATGFLAMWFGSSVFVPLFVGLSLLRALAALQLPKFRAPEHQASVIEAGTQAGRLRAVMKPWFVLPLVSVAMVYATHLLLTTFGAPLWKAQGIPEGAIGIMIALGSFAEAAMFFVWKRFNRKVSARTMILVSALVTVVRWIAMAFSPPLAVLVVLQLLHSATFALGFLGAIHFIANWTSEDIAAEAQSFLTVLQQAFSVVALLGFGWIVAVIGPNAYFVAAAFALIGAGCVWLSLRMVQPKE